jgi:hypothetical protein
MGAAPQQRAVRKGEPESLVSAPPRRIDWTTIFGYDVFISYKRSDASGFAAAVAQELLERDYTCFLDKSEAPPGVHLDDHIGKALARSRALLVIVTPGALDSPWVTEELRIFLGGKRRPVLPIDVDSRFASLSPGDTPWGELRKANPIWLDVNSSDIASGQPNVKVINEIERLFRYTKANTVRRVVISAVGVALLGAAAFAGVKAVQENHARMAAETSATNERAAREYANGQTKLALDAGEQQRLARIDADEQKKKAIAAANSLLVANQQLRKSQLKERQALADKMLAYTGPPDSMRKSGWRTAQDLGLRSSDLPLRPGSSIGAGGRDSPTGTLCCLVADATGKQYLLALSYIWPSAVTTSIVHPGRIDIGAGRQVVVGLLKMRGSDPVWSGALAELRDGVKWDNTLPHIRKPLMLARTLTGGVGPPPPQMIVHILGRGSGLVLGHASEVTDDLIDIYAPEGAVFSEPGDAGALVLNAAHELIGLVWGGQRQEAFAVPIQKVFAELKVHLVN